VNFAPKLALLSRDAEENAIFVIEVEPGTCACGGGVGKTQRPVPAMSHGLLAVGGLLLGLLGYFGVRRPRRRV
jgi:LPXTG-motif cell wall-anchored protein